MKHRLLGILAVFAIQTTFGQDVYNRARADLSVRDTAAAVVAFREAVKAGQKAGEANFYLGSIAFAKRNFPDAVRYLEASLKYNDENVEALRLLGDSHLELKDVQAALTQYRKAAKLAPKNGPIVIAYGKALLAADSVDAAIVYLTRAIEFEPANPAIYLALGDAYLKQNVLVLAETQYRKAVDLDPKSIDVRLKLARTLARDRKYSEAVKEYEGVVAVDSNYADAYLEVGTILVRASQFRRAISPLKKFTAMRPKSFEGWSWYTKAVFGAEDYNETVVASEKANMLDSSSADLWRMRGHAQVELKDCQSALYAFAKLEKLKAIKSEDLSFQGRAYAMCKQPEKAQSLLEEALKVDSANCEVFVPLASIYMTKQDYDRAAVYFEKKINCDPKSSKALTSYVNAAICYFQKKNYPRTRELLYRSIEVWPEFLTAQLWIGRYYTAVDSLDKAKEQYDEVLRIIGPNTEKYGAQAGEAHSMVGSYFFTIQQYPKAVDEFRKALTFGYDNASTRISLGQALMQMLDPKKPDENKKVLEDATKQFRKAIDQDPNSASAHLWLGQCLIMMRVEGDEAGNAKLKEEACNEYRKVLKIDPRNADAKKAMERVGCPGAGK